MQVPVLHKIPALAPTELSEITARAVNELLREGESENTRASYRSALRYWGAWYGLRYGVMIALPVATPCVLQFIVDHAQRTTPGGLTSELPAEIDQVLVDAGYKGRLGPPSHNTLVHRIAVLSKAHQMRHLKNPCHDAQVRELLSRTRKAYAKRGALPQKKDALTKGPLQALLDTCDDSLRGKRDRALLLFAWASGGRRRSEVAGAQMQFLKRIGPGEFIYTLAHSKTNQAGVDRPDNEKPLLGAAGLALQAWLEHSQITQGAIFRRIRKGGHLAQALAPAAIRTIVLERCTLAGIEGNFSAHSLRSGFVTEAARQDVSLAETMSMTGHRSITTVLGYFRAQDSLTRRAGRLIE